MTLSEEGGDSINVVAVNLSQRLALREDDILGDIIDYLDFEGEETSDEKEAAFAIVEWRGTEGGWSCLEIEDYETDQAITH